MAKSLDDILGQIGVPLDAILKELDEFLARFPDLADAVAQAKAKILEKFTPEAIAAKAAADVAELIAVIQAGHGEIDKDNITDIQ
jgi:hypothetical protein